MILDRSKRADGVPETALRRFGASGEGIDKGYGPKPKLQALAQLPHFLDRVLLMRAGGGIQ